MTRRFRAREVALQLLFQFDLNPNVERLVQETLARERLKDAEVVRFCLELYDGAVAQRELIDRQLAQAAQNWRLVRMAAVDRNVLRLGAFELLFTPSTPPAVVINEAIELSRRFGSKDSPSFINGILDQILQMRNTESTARSENPTIEQVLPE